jgi:hypothetical protein
MSPQNDFEQRGLADAIRISNEADVAFFKDKRDPFDRRTALRCTEG